MTEPIRSCVGCGRKAPQHELLRFVACDGRLVPGSGEPGRGAYTCRRLSCFERAVARLSPRPWLMIHGAKDAYIGPEIARRLFEEAREPKELWIVPGAKHNRCRDINPAAYRERVAGFIREYAPRRTQPAVAAPPAVTPREVAAPVQG